MKNPGLPLISDGPVIHIAPIDAGLRALCSIAAYYRIAADPAHLQRELAIVGREATASDLLRAGKLIGLKVRMVRRTSEKALTATPAPAIARLTDGDFVIYGGRLPNGLFRIIDPVTNIDRVMDAAETVAELEPELILLARRFGGEGFDPKTFGFRWFLPSLWRYRKPFAHVLLASLFVQIFALVTPLFFQVVVDKVLAHKGYSTLLVLVVGVIIVGVFDVILQYQRTYALSHTTNRIDVELGQRLFRHLLHLPLAYFETRAAGQTVARVRELENIRAFLTGQGLFSALDLMFTLVFIAVLFAYSWRLSLIVVGAIPFYVAIATLIRPALQERVKERFNAGAMSQQFLVESVVGMQTVKASAVEPIMQAQWEERLAVLREDLFRGDAARRFRPERRAIRQPRRHRLADPVRRQVGDRRRAYDRRAGGLQHDRRAGDAAGAAPGAIVAGLPAGAGFRRTARRHPQRAGGADDLG